MEKRKTSAVDLAFDMIRTAGQLIQGKAPNPEKAVTPGMKHIAKGIGDIAVFGWTRNK